MNPPVAWHPGGLWEAPTMAVRARPRSRYRYPKHYEPGHTKRSGLDGAHQKTRRQQIRELAAHPGAPCPRCGLPMFATIREAAMVYHPGRFYLVRGTMVEARRMWPLDLDDFPGRYWGGRQEKRLSHRACNRSAGAALSNAIQAATRTPKYARW